MRTGTHFHPMAQTSLSGLTIWSEACPQPFACPPCSCAKELETKTEIGKSGSSAGRGPQRAPAGGSWSSLGGLKGVKPPEAFGERSRDWSLGHAGDLGLNAGSGRSSGEGNGNPLQYSCLENPMDGGAWQVTVHGVTKSQA